MKYLTSVLFVIMLGISPAIANDHDIRNELQDLLNQTHIENPNTPGISLFVMCPDLDLDWSAAAGKMSHDSETSLTPKHTFRIASNTKTYVAAAILRLAELGKLNTGDSIKWYLPKAWEKLLADDGYDLDAITLRMILSHTAGLNDHSSDDRYGETIMDNPQRRWLPDDQIGLLVDWFDPLGKPGEKYAYSDDGYIILGKVIELVTGKTLGPAIRDLLNFEALGLHATWWEIMEEQPAAAGPRAHQYYFELDTWDWDPSLDLYGGGGLLTDTRDLGVFTRKLLNGEVLKTRTMLKRMINGGTSEYRLGLISFELESHKVLGHTGFWNTFVFHVPELDITVSGCILNHDAIRGTELAKKIILLVAAEMEK